MCGIAGYLNRDGRPVDIKALAAMGNALIHRGPDGDGIWSEGDIGFAHRRLAIRDLSSNARQPMADPTGRIVVTYNGEIFNDRELRGELERDFGFKFRSSCDTEILPFAYLAWGETMFDRLEGFYALGLWDRGARRRILGCDAIGITPIYYAECRNCILS